MTDNPFLRREAAHGIGKAGRRAEKALEQRIGARGTAASGAFVGDKGDMTLGRLLIEAKSTTADSMALQLDWLAKIEKEARTVGRLPAVAINFTLGDGRPRPSGSWVVIREVDLMELLEGRS